MRDRTRRGVIRELPRIRRITTARTTTVRNRARRTMADRTARVITPPVRRIPADTPAPAVVTRVAATAAVAVADIDK